MNRALRVLLGFALLAGGALLSLYGLFAVTYRGDSRSGDTYVTFDGHEIDADVAGATALTVALVAIIAARFVLKRERRFVEPS